MLEFPLYTSGDFCRRRERFWRLLLLDWFGEVDVLGESLCEPADDGSSMTLLVRLKELDDEGWSW